MFSAHVYPCALLMIKDDGLECMYSDILVCVVRTPYKEPKRETTLCSNFLTKGLAGVRYSPLFLCGLYNIISCFQDTFKEIILSYFSLRRKVIIHNVVSTKLQMESLPGKCFSLFFCYEKLEFNIDSEGEELVQVLESKLCKFHVSRSNVNVFSIFFLLIGRTQWPFTKRNDCQEEQISVRATRLLFCKSTYLQILYFVSFEICLLLNVFVLFLMFLLTHHVCCFDKELIEDV